jgi:hypothetical protein
MAIPSEALTSAGFVCLSIWLAWWHCLCCLCCLMRCLPVLCVSQYLFVAQYRVMDINYHATPQLSGAPVTQPSLFIAGTQDMVLAMSGAQNAYLLRCHFMLMMSVSPRHARDKHRKSTQKEICVFRRWAGEHQEDPLCHLPRRRAACFH